MMKYSLMGLTLLFVSLPSFGQMWDHTVPVRLEGTANSEDGEESIPIITKDRMTLYFVRSHYLKNKGGMNDYDIWYSSMDTEGKFTGTKKLKSLNNKLNNAIVSVSNDGKTLYLLDAYDGLDDERKGISMSSLLGSKWSKPVRMDIPTLDIDGDFYGFHVSEDEKTIIISYEGPGTLGGEDLYVSTKEGNAWSKPVHMGSAINSKGYEMSPYLTPGQDTIYFSSDGFGGEGSADIFFSVKQGSWTEWSEPHNLGEVINSPKFDAYFTLVGNKAVWSSNKDGDFSDIYTVDVIKKPADPLSVTCEAKDVTTHGGEDGEVDAQVSGGVSPYSYSWSNESAEEDLVGVIKGDYTITVTDVNGMTASITCTVNEPAAPLAEVPGDDKTVEFEELNLEHYFGVNRYKLSVQRGELKEFVEAIQKQIKDGRDKVSIQIYSSASKIPTTTYKTNENLAKLRASNMKKLLDGYFSKQSDAVEVIVVETSVNGPDYINDATNQEKYKQHQYVKLQTK